MTTFRGTAARLRASVATFCRDETGSATIWNLTWLIGFCIMTGLAIDSTNARRHETMMQATADAASLAGVIDLPNPYDEEDYQDGAYGTVEYSALDYATRNMKWSEHGVYTDADDVFVGHWDFDSRTFTWGRNFRNDNDGTGDYILESDGLGGTVRKDVVANAVQVWAGRNEENNNWVQTSYLRLAGQTHWNINVAATAAVGAPDCIERGFMAEDEICFRSNHRFDMDTCLYGHEGLNFRNNNIYTKNVEARTGVNHTNNIDDSNYPSNGQPGLIVTQPKDTAVPIVNEIYEITLGMMQGRGFALRYNMADMVLTDIGDDPNDEDPKNRLFDTTVYELDLPNNSTIENVYPGAGDQTWWRGEDDFDVAFAGPISNLVSLLAMSNNGNGNGNGGGNNGGGGGGNNGGGNNGGGNNGGGGLSDGCNSGGSGLTRYSNAEVSAGETMLSNAEPSILEPVAVTSTDDVASGNMYWSLSNQRITLAGRIENILLVSHGPIEIANDAEIIDSTIISLHTGTHAISIGTDARIGAADGCAKNGGTMLMAVGGIHGSAGVQFFGSVVATAGTAHFAAGATSYTGLATYAKGNVSFAANAELTTFNSKCTSEVYVEDEHLIYRLVQ